jgi:hypothetical protein
VPEDLTRSQMRDIGWYPDADLDLVADDDGDACLGSNLAPTVVIQACSSGVANTFFANGCTISDKIAECAAGVRNHGQFAKCATQYLDSLVVGGTLTQVQKDAIQSCVAQASFGR